jgi:malonyl-ACP decarboxylase
MGIVSSIGHDIAAFTRSLADGKSGIGRLARQAIPALSMDIGAEIADFRFPSMLEKMPDLPEALLQSARHVARRSPFTVQASVASALQAWTQARLHAGEIPPQRIGLVIAGHNTTQNYQYGLFTDFQRNPEYLSPRYALQFMDSDQLGALSEIFGIKGEGFVVGGASASGNVGVIHGARLIQVGLVDACLVVGVVADPSPMEIQGFCNIGAMGGKGFHEHPEKACRPFDALHEGFVYGQASACLVLESGGSARNRNVPSLAQWLGGAINLHSTASAEPDIDAEASAMKAALRQGGLAAGEIDYVNTHGSSSPLGDSVEIEAIERVFGDHFPDVWLNATKGLTGHCLCSAGVVEIIASVIQMQHGFIHANINLDNPINSRARFCGATTVREQVRTAMSNSFGFGGINTSVVLRKGD